MFKTVFLKLVDVGDREGRPEQFYREVELPFPPTVGLRVSGDWGNTDSATGVRFDTRTNIFWCDTARDVSFAESLYEKTDAERALLFKQKIEDMEDHGWVHFTRDTRPDFWFGISRAKKS